MQPLPIRIAHEKLRWQQRLENFENAMARLSDACDQERYSDLERAGLIETFRPVSRMKDSIKDRHQGAIMDIIAANERVDRAVLSGSRAMGTNTATSDVDLVLFGDNLTFSDYAP